MSLHPFSLIADFDGNINDLLKMRSEGTLPVLPLRNMVLFPGVVASVSIGRTSSQELVQYATKQGDSSYIAVSTQVDPNIDHPTLEDIYPIGTLAKILRLIELPNQPTTAILQSYGRINISRKPTRTTPFLRTHVEHIEDILPEKDNREFDALYEMFRDTALQYINMSDNLGMEAMMAVQNISNPIYFINFVGTNLTFDLQEKMLLLEEGNMMKRTLSLLRIMRRELQFLRLKKKIQEKTKEELDQQQKEYFLQQQLKSIQNELGVDETADAFALKKKAENLQMPDTTKALFEKEVQKLERINPNSPDYSVTLNYLETVVALPWGKTTEDNRDIHRARRVLDRDHYGMEKVKERILEQLALMNVSRTHRPSILCLYGPPGVGKTSLCRSIAESLGRKYVRISLGGLHDESEIRGHRRTYVAAMCGRIMKSIIKAGCDNPLFVLDEIDKVSGGNLNGDPQSALLELLDPEQNNSFHDNYLDFDYDLSKVFFIATANNLSTIPGPLRDRMELISVEGYLTEEKKEILRRHLIPNALKGISTDYNIRLTPAASEFLIEKYTRESGVRQLEKQVAKIIRKVVLNHALKETNESKSGAMRPTDVQRIMGTPPYSRDSYQGNDYAGVVTGLAWTSVGGEILFIESSVSRSKTPRLTLTGNLGDVMKESAMLALEYIKSHATLLNIDYQIFNVWNVHIHVPEGATPKDGPSAGITIATSLASTFTQRKVRPNIAMTGEITLRGKVLPVGGIKEKILAAKRAGMTNIILSADNKKDVIDIPERYIKDLTFHYVNSIEDVWNIALLEEKVAHAIDLSQPLTATLPQDETF